MGENDYTSAVDDLLAALRERLVAAPDRDRDALGGIEDLEIAARSGAPVVVRAGRVEVEVPAAA